MFRPSRSFLDQSLVDFSLDMSAISRKQSLIVTAGSSQAGQTSCDSEMPKDKYQLEYIRFKKAHHQRSKSQMDKINRIIQDANDLNEILNDADKWLSKRAAAQGKSAQKLQAEDLEPVLSPEQRQIKWRGGFKNGQA